VPFTETEEKYALESLELQDLRKTGDIKAAVTSLINHQESAAMAHPDQYPYYCNLECKTVQELALEKVGSQFGTLEEIKSLLDWSAANNRGVIDLEHISEYIEQSPQAEIYRWIEGVAPKVMGRELTKAEYAQYLYQAYQKAGAAFLDSPHLPKITVDQQHQVIDELKQLISHTEEFKVHAPEFLKVAELHPLGPLFVDDNGTALRMRVRSSAGTASGESSPFGAHGEFDFINKPSTGSPDWFGEDFVPLEHSVAGTIVVSPISGKVADINLNEVDDGEGNSILVEGTGEYEGMRYRILHLKNVAVSAKGQHIKKGQPVGEINIDHTHFGISQEKDGRIIPLPTRLLFGSDAGLEKVYGSGQYIDKAGVSAKTYAEMLPMDTILPWISPWNLSSDIKENYLLTIKTHFTDIYDKLPQIMKE
jgi:murein DD-endopeptidase MepM/ murein hydrolase activator NlpD